MRWETQGRQQHGWFGTGTAGTEGREVAVQVAYAAIGRLPPAQRGSYEGWLSGGGIDQVAAVLPGWVAGCGLSVDRFRDVFFGAGCTLSIAEQARRVGAGIVG